MFEFLLNYEICTFSMCLLTEIDKKQEINQKAQLSEWNTFNKWKEKKRKKTLFIIIFICFKLWYTILIANRKSIFSNTYDIIYTRYIRICDNVACINCYKLQTLSIEAASWKSLDRSTLLISRLKVANKLK